MSATATPTRTFPTVGPIVERHIAVTTIPLPDPRPARGKHRAGLTLDGVLAGWRRARVEVAVAAASVGAVLAAVLS